MTRRYIPQAIRRAVDARDACEACGGLGPFDRDHKHALALGGGNEADNPNLGPVSGGGSTLEG